MTISFSKYSGSGNDFILIDNRKQLFPKDSGLVQNLCHRQQGIGADGIILLQETSKADVEMFIYNADGSIPEMCGNGARCFVKFLKSLGFQQDLFKVWVSNRLLTFINKDSTPLIDMGKPVGLNLDISLDDFSEFPYVHYVDTGVPHIVVFVENISSVNVPKLGKALRFHGYFQPKGANVNFVQIDSSSLKVRTYERGVEGETLACGTGATAAALIASLKFSLFSPVLVKVASGDTLTITFDKKGLEFSSVFMGGEAQETFSGSFHVHQFLKQPVFV